MNMKRRLAEERYSARCGVSLGVAVALAVCAAGCKSDPHQELLERQLRIQEDKIYELEAELEACQHGGVGPKIFEGPLRLEPTPADPPSEEAPSVELPPSAEDDEDFDGAPPFTPPQIEPPGPGVPEARGEPPSRGPQRITLNPRLTGGWNADNEPGDEGIMAVVEPVDGKGNVIRARGEVSIVVLDPQRSGPAARVARWDFPAEDAAAHFEKTLLGHGMHFELRWPGPLPRHRKLMLYVRLVDEDGRELRTEQEIHVDLPGEDIARTGWTRAVRPLPQVKPADYQRDVPRRQSEPLPRPSEPPPAEKNRPPKRKPPVWGPGW